MFISVYWKFGLGLVNEKVVYAMINLYMMQGIFGTKSEDGIGMHKHNQNWIGNPHEKDCNSVIKFIVDQKQNKNLILVLLHGDQFRRCMYESQDTTNIDLRSL